MIDYCCFILIKLQIDVDISPTEVILKQMPHLHQNPPHHRLPRKDFKQLISLIFLMASAHRAPPTSSTTTSWKPSPTATSTAPPTSAPACNFIPYWRITVGINDMFTRITTDCIRMRLSSNH